MTTTEGIKNYMVIVKVGADETRTYLTKVRAVSHSQAEHVVLGLAYVGKHRSTVVGCQAYDAEDMKYGQFIGSALEAVVVSFFELEEVIASANNDLKKMDEAEETIARCEREIEQLQQEMAQAKKILGIH